MDRAKRSVMGTAWKLGVRQAAGQNVSAGWDDLIRGWKEHDVLDMHAALVFGACGDSFADFMAQRFPEEVVA